MSRIRPTDGVMVGSARPDEAWRLATAQRVADAYPSDRPAVIAVAGSVGAGLADRWSDLELDYYWRHAPTDADRREPIDRRGAEVSGFWDYDADEQEWSEDYRLGQLNATISNFTVAAVDELITAVRPTDRARWARDAARRLMAGATPGRAPPGRVVADGNR